MDRVEQHAIHDGNQEVWKHLSSTLGCEMKFGIFLPKSALAGKKCPVLYWLSGLTCNEQNFITKAGAQRYAAEHSVILVAPDTSPRGGNVADDEAYDLGKGAGFYVNATQQPWANHYRMYDYVVDELPRLVEDGFPASDARSISGHSMGGHGALMIALRNPGRYRSVSAFSPIVAPSEAQWGEKAFSTYIGDNRELWKQYDTVELVKLGAERIPLLIDQGEADEYLLTQLKPQLLKVACASSGHPLQLHMRAGYDHSYYFVASFIGEHIAYHARNLQ
ncbi:S-formylglutathione hydrolase [Paraburkholderia sp. J67]|uniref:S-formylglutathione hydrolase n=1 Tax=Paraburkholderia sp. J67 TaxID=2805435 RepID=UPI002ABDA58D|nr:S-formylglutathione hydrolase [Paraburkholderia sp. J67]